MQVERFIQTWKLCFCLNESLKVLMGFTYTHTHTCPHPMPLSAILSTSPTPCKQPMLVIRSKCDKLWWNKSDQQILIPLYLAWIMFHTTDNLNKIMNNLTQEIMQGDCDYIGHWNYFGIYTWWLRLHFPVQPEKYYPRPSHRFLFILIILWQENQVNEHTTKCPSMPENTPTKCPDVRNEITSR